jgi:hypothetical protein
MRASATRYFRYSPTISRAPSPFVHHGSVFAFSATTGYAIRVANGSWCLISAIARGMCQLEVTTISELKLCSTAQRFVSSALPNVLSAERSRSMQQRKNLA